MFGQVWTGLGQANVRTRPTVDYVRAGDVLRVKLVWSSADTVYYGSDPDSIMSNLRARLGAIFNVIHFGATQSGWLFGGTNVIDLQARGDFARLNDVVSIVAGEADRAGLNVDVPATRGEFVSKVENTGGDTPQTLPAPSGDNSGAGDVLSNVGEFFTELTKSPVTLAVLAGAAVLLVIAVKK